MGDRRGSSDKINGAFLLYCVGFVSLALLLALLGAIGLPDRVVGPLLIGSTLLAFAVIGLANGTMQAGDFFVAGRRIPAVYNGMATAAGWLAAGGFLGLAASFYLLGRDGLVLMLGWAAGFVLAAALLVPYLRKSGAVTVPDFLAARYGGNPARLVGVVVLLCCCFLLAAAQLHAAGLVAGLVLGMDADVAIYAGLGVVLSCTMFGGMRALTWTQVAQYVVLALAYLVPAIWMSTAKTGNPVPYFAYGEALRQIGLMEAAQPVVQGPFGPPGHDAKNFLLPVICLAVGTASMPHLLMRSFTTPSVSAARFSAAWALLFVLLICAAAPAYAAFARWALLELVASGLTPDNLPAKAAWLMRWASIDPSLVEICGNPATDAAAVVIACAERGVSTIGPGDIRLAPGMIVLAMPDMVGMPYVVSALVGAGALAATLAAAGGLLLAIGNTLGHDVYHKMIDREASPDRRVVVSRVMLLAAAVLAAHTASSRPSDVVSLVSWGSSLAASGLFPALVLGIWWKRATTAGAVAGMVVGFGVCLYYLFATHYGAVGFYEIWSSFSSASPEAAAEFSRLKAVWLAAAGDAKAAARVALNEHARTIADWWGVKSLSAAAFGAPAGLLTIVIVSVVTRGPSAEVEGFIDAIRTPDDGAVLDPNGLYNR
ncbi:hypothetical protein MesoLjLc_45300 [Mesorhizobium sp. L-8-10]|uniref:VC_2705 family sodium/solute symporter n=1 Tax=Mesorhizobium sp. L-8-10 TaxID=2744523 RepID=UPI00192889CF|nr:VC_2705 family sodium/solute symporter [Mesorhizobium sp. L-8-10]BCH32600.1 hypothetical protein MesoLjLc_45300 [Mesorhizobium sp. L-8-10]